MKFVPLLRCLHMREAVDFYTRVLGFALFEGDTPDDVVVGLNRGGSILQLSTIDGQSNIAVNVVVDDVDTTWAEIIERGFVPPDRPDARTSRPARPDLALPRILPRRPERKHAKVPVLAEMIRPR